MTGLDNNVVYDININLITIFNEHNPFTTAEDKQLVMDLTHSSDLHLEKGYQ